MKKKRLAVAAILALAGVIALIWADRAFYAEFKRKALEVKIAAGRQSLSVVTEDDLRGLPEPLTRHLRFSGVMGKKRISAVRLTHSGQFKPGAKSSWMPIRGEYSISTKRPSFIWYGKISMAPGLSICAIDSYFDGQGRMLIKALSAYTIADAQSAMVDQSAFGRCVAEMAVAPTFFLDRSLVSCAQTDVNRLKCRVADDHFSTNADLHVNPDGSLERIIVERFYDRGNGRATLEKFTGRGSNPKDFSGLMLSSQLDGFWNLPEGDLHYVSFVIDSVEYE
jgi:hypothetical protein